MSTRQNRTRLSTGMFLLSNIKCYVLCVLRRLTEIQINAPNNQLDTVGYINYYINTLTQINKFLIEKAVGKTTKFYEKKLKKRKQKNTRT